MNDDLVRRIDALLPQTQCTRCGFDGCRPYATAIAEGRADSQPVSRLTPTARLSTGRLIRRRSSTAVVGKSSNKRNVSRRVAEPTRLTMFTSRMP